jgi:hypothetical protein
MSHSPRAIHIEIRIGLPTAPLTGSCHSFSPAPLAADQTTLEMADSLGMFIGPEQLQQIHAHDARIRAVLSQPAYRRPEPIYAVLYVGLDP